MSASVLLPRTGNAAAAAEPAPFASEPCTRAVRPGNLRGWAHGVEFLAVLLVALVAAALHVQFITHVGGIWRDETNSINLATLSTFSEIWHFLDYDSFPILFFAVLRGWAGLFGAGNDAALRALGLITGLGVLGVLWANARSFGVRWPVLSFALVGLNPMVIRYGDSTRAYGLGIILILLTLGAFWRLVNSPSPPSIRRVLAATVLSLLSVHCLYYNSVLLLAIALGALAVAARERAWRTAVTILGIGTLAAVSLLPYAPIIIRMRAWTFMVSYPADFAWLWKRACEVMGSPDPLIVWLWISLFTAGLAVVLWLGAGIVAAGFARRRVRAGGSQHAVPTVPVIPSAVLFAAITLVVGIAGYAIFLRLLNYYTQPWYYVTLAVFAACTLEVVFGAWPFALYRGVFTLAFRGSRVAVALGLLAFAAPAAWQEMPTRHTNLDLIGTRLQQITAKGDLILVPRWECAITLSRYYKEPAEILTIPRLDDHRVHRYDLVLGQMMTRDAHLPILARLEEVLRAGHRIFVVGTLPVPSPDFRLPVLPPAYRDPNGGWHGAPYDQVWQLHAGGLLRAHATNGGQLPVPVPGNARVQEFEKLELGVFEGWR